MFEVRELRRARADIASIVDWLFARSSAGAAAWLDAYDEMVTRLKADPEAFGEAPENATVDRVLKQTLFKTRRGRTYRAIFFTDNETVYILRVRGPEQAPVEPSNLF